MSYHDIEEGNIYKGTVTGLKNFGAFISMSGSSKDNHQEDIKHHQHHHRHSSSSRNYRNPSGLCHISQISSTRKINNPDEVLKMGQQVYVKVTAIQEDGKISLTMRNIDQVTGTETDIQRDDYVNESNGNRYQLNQQRNQKRKNEPDLWELNQLNKAFGAKKTKVHSADDIEDPFAEVDSDTNEEEAEEDVEIELTNEVPSFLEGKSYKTNKGEPVKFTRTIEGSMNRVAQNGSKFMEDSKRLKLDKRMEEDRLKRQAQRLKKTDDPMLEELITKIKMQKEKEAASEQAVENWKNQARAESYGIRSHMSIREQRESLPVFDKRDELLKEIEKNDFMVVVGETGSGKTTQITQYLAEDGYGDKGIIACTQPRRVAATSVARRVAEEVGCKVGDEVGYTIRFEDVTSDRTMIKYMTDGMLQVEALTDPDMNKYSVIMLDEAHERTVATDVLFALLRDAVVRRKGTLKLIVTSATLDSAKFSKYFNDCPVFHIKGRTFPVKIFYTKQPELDYIEATIDTVIDVHMNNDAGDILVFLTGREEIDTCCETIIEKMSVLYKSDPNLSELIVLPIYSALPSEMQSRIFEPTPKGKRKVVLATNIAETSITIDGIYFVVDPGFVKVKAYNAKLGMDSLIVQPISRAQADQRSGRAGRTGPGICFRLYTKNAYLNEMSPNTVPEIKRQNLSNTILNLKAMGIEDVLNFGFMDPPEDDTILSALDELYILDALDQDGRLTRTGKYMAYFPLEPMLTKTLIKSMDFQCSYEVIIIIAMLSIPDVFFRPKERREQADKMKAKFNDYNGDHLTLLNVYIKWEDSNFSKSWCEDHFIHDKSLKKARDVKKQLLKILEDLDRKERKLNSSITSCRGNYDQIRKAFVSGFFKNCAKRSANHGHTNEEGSYRTLVENIPVYMHPSSSLFKKHGVEYLIYHTLVLTNKEYMHCISKIDPKWLILYAPKFFKQADPNELSLTKKRERIQPLFNRNDPKEKWRLSRGRR